MKLKYLGDSFDAVKRLWRELLHEKAPLFACGRFIPEELRNDFMRLTGIKVLPDQLAQPYSILNDPDTGIRLPGEDNQDEGRTHISIQSIVDQLRQEQVYCVITFDQSDYRQSDLDRKEQRRAKMTAITSNQGYRAFYYVSHAPFLFAFSNQQAFEEVREFLINAGIPNMRLETV